jgi:hypothetical protein
MLPPYQSDEVAQAVLARLAQAGERPAPLTVTVTADNVARAWRIEARFADGREVVGRYPFSAPAGIHTPAELADWFAAEVAID